MPELTFTHVVLEFDAYSLTGDFADPRDAYKWLTDTLYRLLIQFGSSPATRIRITIH